MFSDKYFSISDFAKLVGVTRQTLLYYDRIDLFKPIKTLENGYRVYSRTQINIFSLIYMLGEMGVPLKEIKQIVERISPDTAIEVLKKQQCEVQKKVQKLEMLEGMMALRMEQIALGREILERPDPDISITELSADTPVYLGERIDCSWEAVTDEMLIDFYTRCEARGLPMIFSGGLMKRREMLQLGELTQISQMFCRLRDSRGSNAVIPRGSYAVAYAKGAYANVGEAYSRILSYIKEARLQIIGNAYEEYLLDELAESHPERFVVRIMVQVFPT